ncbi:Rieske 2Fe-2S domain-containing protein [Candidatus Binatia bacterium]|nr:Rieske 2Fe-2S domain-containing protein [Candidatus Binatia bacterium]
MPVPIPLPDPGRTAPFRVAGRDLLLCNVDGAPYVLDDRCSHARTALAGGRLSGFVLECPLHGGKIDVRDGSPAAPPVRRAVACWPVRRVGERIEIALATAAARDG